MSDELDDVLDGGRANLEARFRELERQDEIRRMRQRAGAGPSPASTTADDDRGAGEPVDGDLGDEDLGDGDLGDDDLADVKAALDDDAPLERYVLVLCPSCGAKNRTSLTKVRTRLPVCGGCRAELSFTRLG